MTKLYRILGKRGRITIPFEIRQRVGFSYNDVLSFTESPDGRTVTVKREKICDNCSGTKETEKDNEMTLEDFLDSLSAEQQRVALVHLSVKWAEKKNKNFSGLSVKNLYCIGRGDNMLKNKIILAVIAAIVVLSLAGCKAEKDNVSSTSVNTESGITETVSDIAEPPTDTPSNKTAEITEKPESSAPTESINRNNPTESIKQNNSKPANSEKTKTPEPESGKSESEKPPAPTESVSKPEEIQIPSESSEPEKQEPEFSIDYYIKAAQEYAVKSGLKLDPQAKYCWDNPISAGKNCKYTERDIKSYIDRYARLPEITAVWIWAEENGKDYEIYIGYA